MKLNKLYVIPTILQHLKEQINIRVLGTPNPIKIVSDEELLVEEVFERHYDGACILVIYIPASILFWSINHHELNVLTNWILKDAKL